MLLLAGSPVVVLSSGLALSPASLVSGFFSGPTSTGRLFSMIIGGAASDLAFPMSEATRSVSAVAKPKQKHNKVKVGKSADL